MIEARATKVALRPGRLSDTPPLRMEPERPSAGAARIEGIDVARGLASAIMIQGHAYDGWVADEHKTSAAYLFTRVLGTLPLPSFLVLAGAAVALRVDAAHHKGEDASLVRAALAKRGLTIVFFGYLVNLVSALMDGAEGLETFTRADVLQVIGLSLATLALAGVRQTGGALHSHKLDLAALDRAALALAIVPILICPWVTAWSITVTGPWRHLLAPLVDIPGITQMPYVPLAAWAGIGALLGRFLLRQNAVARSTAGAPDRVLLALLIGALLTVVGFSRLTELWVEASGEALSRAHVAVIPNAIELAARGVVVLAIGALLTRRIPEAVKRVLVRLGRGSLVAYVFHVPFCYGALGLPIRGRLDMIEATFFVVLLEVASFGAVLLRDRFTERRARAKAAAA